MRVGSLGSGSSGNGTLVEGAGTRVLIDCGFGPRITARRLEALGVDPLSLDGIVVSHEHGDHLRGAFSLAAKCGLAVHATHGTLRAAAVEPAVPVRTFDIHRPFRVGGLTLHPVPVVHDAAEPCQFVVDDGRSRFGLLTDSGEVTPHIQAVFGECDGLLLECNHDPGMLRGGPYPPWLQARIAGRQGHLGNHQAASLCATLELKRVQWILAGHLSERNNSPRVVRGTLAPVLDAVRLEVLTPVGTGEWFELV